MAEDAGQRSENEQTPNPATNGESPAELTIDIGNPGLEKVLRKAGVDPANPQVVRTLEVMSVSATLARGSLPLPPPALLQEYSLVMPGLPEKLVEWTEVQAAHRRELENQRAWGAERRMDRGQIGALCVSLVGLAVAGLVGIWGNPWVGAVIAVVSVGGPAAAVLLAANSSLPGSSSAAKSSNVRPPQSPIARK